MRELVNLYSEYTLKEVEATTHIIESFGCGSIKGRLAKGGLIPEKVYTYYAEILDSKRYELKYLQTDKKVIKPQLIKEINTYAFDSVEELVNYLQYENIDMCGFVERIHRLRSE